jgi:hypothetical protein
MPVAAKWGDGVTSRFTKIRGQVGRAVVTVSGSTGPFGPAWGYSIICRGGLSAKRSGDLPDAATAKAEAEAVARALLTVETYGFRFPGEAGREPEGK